MSASVVQWICRELSRLLGFEATEDIARYILTIETASDLRDYMHELLDPDNPQNQKFVTQLISKWKPPDKRKKIPNNIQVYKKSDNADEFVSSKETNAKQNKKQKSKKSSAPIDTPAVPIVNGGTKSYQQNGENLKSGNFDTGTGAIRKTKFVPLFSDDGHAKTVARLPGRYSCECLATKHNLVNNCTKCGRIVCDQEGSGPCVFCGNLVCTNEEMELLARGNKKSEKLKQELLRKRSKQQHTLADIANSNNNSVHNDSKSFPNTTAQMQESFQKAKEHKDKLLEYDKSSVKRTQVIDDQSDYFASDSRWLNKDEKQRLKKREEELSAKRHSSRKDRKVTLDFAGRQVLETNDFVDVYNVNDSVIQNVHFRKSDDGNKAAESPVFRDEDFTDLVNPIIKETKQAAPKYVDTTGSSKSSKMSNINSDDSGNVWQKKANRIQDRAILEMSDDGMCMSMHQPWASLLVKGIKRHEGRTWYSSHRGRLWIAATVKPPQDNEIAGVEQQYRELYNDPCLKFPQDYPVGCLLGCVDVVDVLDQEEYQKQTSSEESGSPYVFICENAQELVVKFPMKGKHKIYKIDGHIHQGAKKGLRPS